MTSGTTSESPWTGCAAVQTWWGKFEAPLAKLFVYKKGKGYIKQAASATDIKRVTTGCPEASRPYLVKPRLRGWEGRRVGGSVVLRER